jgi:hypothetical protein
MPRMITIIVIAGIAVLAPALSSATPTDAERAKAAFREGAALYEKGDFIAAAEKFRSCYQLKKSYKIFFNIAQSEAAAKRYGLSLQNFEKFLADGGDDIPLERQDDVRKEIGRLRDMIGFLEVTAPEDVEIIIDGVSRGTYPAVTRIPVAVSVVHELKIVNTEGQESGIKRATVSGGDSVPVSFETDDFEQPPVVGGEPPGVAADAVETEDNMTPEASVSRLTTPSIWKNRFFLSGAIVAGAGVALMAGGCITGIVSLKKDDDVQEKCTGGVCDSRYRDLINTRDHIATTSTVLWVVGGVATATGIALILVSQKKKGKFVSSAISVLPGVGGLIVTGVF